MLENLERYRENSIRTKTKGELLLTLYDEAIKKLGQSKILMENGDKVNSTKALEKAMEIFNYLNVTLDHSQDPQLAKSLEDLYGYFIKEIIKAISLGTTEGIDSILGQIKELRNTWEEADKIARSGK